MDVIADMLIKIKNANRAGHETATVPFSVLKESIAECLVKEGYIKKAEKVTENDRPMLKMTLAYIDGRPRVNDVARVSKPSRRMYVGVKHITTVKNGYGILVLSTPKGILSGKYARKEMVGGEVLFTMW